MSPPLAQRITRYRPYSPAPRAVSGEEAPPIRLGSAEHLQRPPRAARRQLAEALEGACYYPEPGSNALRAELASFHGLRQDSFLVTAGSDEALLLLGLALLDPGAALVCPAPVYALHQWMAVSAGAEVLAIPLDRWRINLKQMQCSHPGAAVILANPHNPTGSWLPPEEIVAFASDSPRQWVIVDEAFVEYVEGYPEVSLLRAITEHENLVVVRTFSRAFGLAGARVGYVAGPPSLIAALDRVRPPYNVSTFGQALAAAALRDRRRFGAARGEVIAQRTRLMALLGELGVEYVPSAANFVLCRPASTTDLVSELAKLGILIRDGAAFGFLGWVRIGVGPAAQMEAVEVALRAVAGTASRRGPGH